jgi:hypothetical protein
VYEEKLNPSHPTFKPASLSDFQIGDLSPRAIDMKLTFHGHYLRQIWRDGTVVPEREAYPSSSQWGSLGWSFPVRYKEWVLGLGRDVIGIRKNRAVSVREASHRLWGPGIGGAGQDGHCREKRLKNRLLRVVVTSLLEQWNIWSYSIASLLVCLLQPAKLPLFTQPPA